MAQFTSISYKESLKQAVLAVGLAAVQFPDLSMSGVEEIFVQAPTTNTDSVIIGASTVTSNFANGGWELAPGASFNPPINLWSSLYAISPSAAQKLLVTYLKGDR